VTSLGGQAPLGHPAPHQLQGWAYARPYISAAQRTAAVGPWTDAYNLHRPRAGVGDLSPWQRLNNLLRNDN
jgi:hypothetical protein